MYLDIAASTAVSNEVKEELLRVIDIYGNPSSLHKAGVEAKKIILNSKNVISKKIGCNTNDIHFTSGATMSNNIIIQGFMKKNDNGVLLYSAIEHNDIMMIAKEYPSRAFEIKVDLNGFIDIEHLKYYLNAYMDIPVLVSIQLANGEIGVIQDVITLSKIIRSYPSTWFHTDATQYIPHYPINIEIMKIDALSMSGQKINCIKGVGLAYIDKTLPISPIILGEQGLIGGTENVYGIACLGKAFECLEYSPNKLSNKRDCLYESLKSTGKLVGTLEHRLPNILTMMFEGVDSQRLVGLLSEEDIYVSTGSACSSHKAEPSHVLIAIGYDEQQANSCIRFSIDDNITYNDLNRVSQSVKNVLEILK